MITTKVVMMDREERRILEDAKMTLDNMATSLENMAKKDDNLQWLADDCWHAGASLNDFLQSYESQFNKTEEE